MCCQKYADSMLPRLIYIVLFSQTVCSWGYLKQLNGSKGHELFVHTLGATPIFLQTGGAYAAGQGQGQ